MAKRPPPPLRVVILLLAIAAMFSAVCAHSRTPAPAANPDARPAQPDAAPAPQAPDKEYFPASKAPGFLYRP